MSTPPWWPELLAASEVLALADALEVARWRGDVEPDVAGGAAAGGPRSPGERDGDDLPLPLRLAHLGRAFADHYVEITERQHRQVLAVLERVMATGTPQDREAVGTGFLDAMLAASDEGFDLRLVWPLLGPASRAFCASAKSFSGASRPIRLPPSW